MALHNDLCHILQSRTNGGAPRSLRPGFDTLTVQSIFAGVTVPPLDDLS